MKRPHLFSTILAGAALTGCSAFGSTDTDPPPLQTAWLRGDLDAATDAVPKETTTPIPKLEQGMVGLAEASLDRASVTFRDASQSLEEEVYTDKTVAEVAGVLVQSVTAGLTEEPYVPPPYQLAVAESVTALSYAARAADRDAALDQARNFASDASGRSIAAWVQATAGVADLGEEFEVSHAHTALPHFLHASLIEHEDRAAADKLYARAAEIEPRPGIDAQRERGAPATGTQPVWIYVLEGPRAYRVEENDAVAGAAKTIVTALIAAAQQIDGGNVAPDVVQTVLSSRFPVPARAPIEPSIAGVDVLVDDAETANEMPLIADLDATAKASFEVERDVRVARQAVRAALRRAGTTAAGASGDEMLGAAAKYGSAAVELTERADLRDWATMPGRVRALRVDLAPGRHRLTLAVRGAPSDVRIGSARITARDAAAANATIDVDVPSSNTPVFVLAVVPSAASIGRIATNAPALVE